MNDDATQPARIVGLKYEAGDGVPQVVLKAQGELAEAVLLARRRAPEAAPVVRDAALLEKLYRLPVDAPIGTELFRAVAVLLAHVLYVDGKLREESHAA
jgi:type III secretion system FlhB-like substrate exporter